jgi:hypothetical protein
LRIDAASVFALRDEPELVVQELDFRLATILLALFRRPVDDNLARTLPLSSWSDPFAPQHAAGVDLLNDLWEADLIRVHPGSSLDAFGWTDNGTVGFYIPNASFTAPGSGPSGPTNARLVAELHNAMSEPWSELWRREALAFVKEILLAEALDYLVYGLKEHGFEFKVGERTRQVAGRALESFSLGAVYSFIWRAVRDAAAYYQRGGIPKAQAANSVVVRIEALAERASAEGWDVKPYGRLAQLPWSVLSETLFVGVLSVSNLMAARMCDFQQATDRHGLRLV